MYTDFHSLFYSLMSQYCAIGAQLISLDPNMLARLSYQVFLTSNVECHKFDFCSTVLSIETFLSSKVDTTNTANPE
jgi:hypothetical protein